MALPFQGMRGPLWASGHFVSDAVMVGKTSPSLGVKDEHLRLLFFCAFPLTPAFLVCLTAQTVFHGGLLRL